MICNKGTISLRSVALLCLAGFACILLVINWGHHTSLNAADSHMHKHMQIETEESGNATSEATAAEAGAFVHATGQTAGISHPILTLPSRRSDTKAAAVEATGGARTGAGAGASGPPPPRRGFQAQAQDQDQAQAQTGVTSAKVEVAAKKKRRREKTWEHQNKWLHGNTTGEKRTKDYNPFNTLEGTGDTDTDKGKAKRKKRADPQWKLGGKGEKGNKRKDKDKTWPGLDLGRIHSDDSNPNPADANATTSTAPSPGTGTGGQSLLRPANTSTTVALAALCRDSAGFDMWLRYYLDYLHLDMLFLRIEGCPEGAPCRTEVAKYPGRIKAYYSDNTFVVKNRRALRTSDTGTNAGVGSSATVGKGRGFFNETHHSTENNYHSMIDRQTGFTNFALDQCKRRGIDFLIHSDADELVYVQPSPSAPDLSRREQLRVVLSQLPMFYDNLHLENFEAIYPAMNREDSSKCFVTDRFRQCSSGGCKSYSNGKGVARVTGRGWRGHKIRAHGPHWFSGKTYDYKLLRPVNPEIAVLHFDSCTVEQWETKFELLKDLNSTNLAKIPFKYYRASIALAQEKHTVIQMVANGTLAATSQEATSLLENYHKSSKALYKANKVDPYYKGKYLLLRYWDKGSTQQQEQKQAKKEQGKDAHAQRIHVKYDTEIYPQFYIHLQSQSQKEMQMTGEEKEGREKTTQEKQNEKEKVKTKSANTAPVTTIKKWYEFERLKKESHAPEAIRKVPHLTRKKRKKDKDDDNGYDDDDNDDDGGDDDPI